MKVACMVHEDPCSLGKEIGSRLKYPITFYPGSFLFKMHSKYIIDLSILLTLIPRVYCNFDPLRVGLCSVEIDILMFLAIPDAFQSFFCDPLPRIETIMLALPSPTH